jgi:ATP-dependent 26S proteasome regulatory subunit
MEAWLEQNNRYLEASLEWLRLRIEKLVSQQAGPLSLPVSPLDTDLPSQPAQGRLSKWRGTTTTTTEKKVRLLPEGNPPSIDERIASAAAAREAAGNMEPPPALVLLANGCGLSPFERDTLLLCAAQEFDPALGALCADAQGCQSRNYPTFSLALRLFDEPRWDAMSAHRPLRYACLVEISQPGAMALTLSALRADERIVNFLKGLNVLDDRLASLVRPLNADQEVPLSASQRDVVDSIMQRLSRMPGESPLPVVQLIGTDPGSRLFVAGRVCEETNRRLYSLGVETIPSPLPELETFVRLWQRESVLLPIALYIDTDQGENISAETQAALLRFLSRPVGMVFVGVRETPLRISSANFSIEVEMPSASEQRDEWTTTLETISPDVNSRACAELLVGQFNLNLNDIREAAAMSVQALSKDEEITTRVWRTCRDLARPSLDTLAQRLEPKATWDDLVLPEEQAGLLRQIVGQVRGRHQVYNQWGFSQVMNRGFGISAMFVGESGTGKTMAAEVIANDLQLNLYRIDLSAVVNKYIGETEKNLRKLFDAAERGGAILFFDEADALFGKRSEVKDSHDRYANIEINYLLQRMEAFSGLAILATNMKSALDTAFMRRLRFIINLPFPGIKERKLIWQKALPQQTPQKNLDYDRLARLSVSGGNIHTIALNAAFLAAQNGQAVTMPLLLSAARTELRKLEKGFSEAEFR